MHHTAGPAYCDASSSSKSSSDNQPVDPMLGGHLLSFNESQLCSTLNIPPTRYLTIKTVLLSNPKLNETDPAEKLVLKHLSTSGWVRKSVDWVGSVQSEHSVSNVPGAVEQSTALPLILRFFMFSFCTRLVQSEKGEINSKSLWNVKERFLNIISFSFYSFIDCKERTFEKNREINSADEMTESSHQTFHRTNILKVNGERNSGTCDKHHFKVN